MISLRVGLCCEIGFFCVAEASDFLNVGRLGFLASLLILSFISSTWDRCYALYGFVVSLLAARDACGSYWLILKILCGGLSGDMKSALG